MKKFTRGMCFALVGVLILGIVAMMAGCSMIRMDRVSKDPGAQLVKSIELTEKALETGFKNDPVTFVLNALKNGTITFDQDSELNGKQTIKLHSNSEKKSYAVFIDSVLEEETTNFAFYVYDGELCVSVPDMPGDTAYSLNLKTLSTDLKSSRIWENVDITYEEFIQEYSDDIAELEKLGKDANTTQGYGSTKTMIENLKTIIRESQVVVTDNSVLTTDELVKCINIQYTLDTSRLKLIVDECANWLKLYYADMVAMSGSLDGSEIQITEESLNKDLDEMKKEVYKMLTDANAKATLTISLNPNTQTIVKVECHLAGTAENATEYVNFTLDLGKNPATSQAYQIRIASSNGTNPEVIYKLIYERMDGNGTFGRSLRFEERNEYGEESSQTISFNWNKADNTYAITTSAYGEKQSISGDFKLSENKLEMTMVGDSVDGKMTLTVEQGTTLPEMPNRLNILKLNDEQYLDLIQYFETVMPKNNFDDLEETPSEDNGPMFEVSITDAYGSITFYTASTDEKYILDALLAEELIALNEEGAILSVYYEEVLDGDYWAVYLNGEEIELADLEKVSYDVEGLSFVYTKAQKTEEGAAKA